MQNMKTVVKGFLSYWADKEKLTDSQTDGQADSSISPYNFVVRGYN